MNFYKLAIENGEVIDFLRGKGKYFESDRDREGEHNFSFTSYNIIDYASIVGETKFYEQLEYDLNVYMDQKDFDLIDFNIVIGIIWVYYFFKVEENKFKDIWVLSDQIVNKIKIMKEKLDSNGSDLSKVNRMLGDIENRFKFKFL